MRAPGARRAGRRPGAPAAAGPGRVRSSQIIRYNYATHVSRIWHESAIVGASGACGASAVRAARAVADLGETRQGTRGRAGKGRRGGKLNSAFPCAAPPHCEYDRYDNCTSPDLAAPVANEPL